MPQRSLREPVGIAGARCFTDQMPFLTPDQQYQSTEEIRCIFLFSLFKWPFCPGEPGLACFIGLKDTMVRVKVGRPPGETGVGKSMECDIFPSVLWHCWLGDRKGIRPVKKDLVLVCWWWWFDWSFARLIAPVVTTTSTILCFNKHRLTQVHLENGR